MKSYRVIMPSGLPFTYITEEDPKNIINAIIERFGVCPLEVAQL